MPRFPYRANSTVDVGSTLRYILDRLPLGIVLLNRRRQIILENEVAREILALGRGLAIVDGCVVVFGKCQPRPLSQLVDDALIAAHVGGEFTEALGVVRASSRDPAIFVEVAPMRLDPLVSHDGSPAVALFMSDDDNRLRPGTAALQTLYGLSTAEAQLAAQLARGARLDDIARQSGRDRETLRTQLKGVFTKTKTRRQAELVSAVLNSIAALRPRGRLTRLGDVCAARTEVEK